MRTIIAGSREGVAYSDVAAAAKTCGWKISAVISGTARGADTLGEQWAARRGIPVERKPANWERYGNSAGFQRNVEMADCAEALIAIWNGKSKGTKHMIDIAQKKGLRVFIYSITA